MSDERPLPEESVADLVIRLARAGVNLIPGGGAVTELASILKTPYERRRDEWLETLWQRLKRLEEQVGSFDVNHLANNEQFVTAVLRATPMAVREHQKGKLEALRNAVLNVAAGSAPEADLQIMFLDAVDSFTSSHVRLLHSLRGSGDAWHGWHSAESARKKTGIDDRLLVQALRDLRNRGFIEINTAMDQLSTVPLGHTNAKLTGYGEEFLDFITSPLEEGDAAP